MSHEPRHDPMTFDEMLENQVMIEEWQWQRDWYKNRERELRLYGNVFITFVIVVLVLAISMTTWLIVCAWRLM